MNDYADTPNVLIANADCNTMSRQPGTGASLCNHYNLPYYPYIIYGDPDNHHEYQGSRDHASMLAFAQQNLGPIDPTPPAPTPPTPTPVPTPPAPTPVPTPPAPTPSPTSYYEHPPCMSDEKQITIDGITGYACSAACTYSSCPSDVPAGVSAQPWCALRDNEDGNMRCALSCSSHSQCDQANGGFCGFTNGYGFCVYSTSKVCAKEVAVAKPVTQVAV